MVTTMMPIMFTVFSIFLPAGLTLYILTNTVLGMVQQEIINRVNKTGAGQAAAAEPTVEVLDAPAKKPSVSKKSPGSKKK
jgi:membrane protein insertase Oxa1/YidC/SpoIIIJ